MSDILQVENLTVNYGAIQALQGISFHVQEGEIVTLIGANGAGKSTTLKTISGLLHPTAGRIVYQGKDIAGQAADWIVKIGITHVPEGRKIFAPLTVRENLEMGAYTRTDKGEIEQAMERVFASFPRLEERLNQLGGTLSGGEQQMLAMARSLMARPKLLLLDEPSLGLAPLVVETILATLTHLREEGMTILLVEQNARAALKIADRAYVLETGRIILSGSAQDLLADRQVTRAYLGRDYKEFTEGR
jgi:branched-chain amino acid transport system ATP-binding protein